MVGARTASIPEPEPESRPFSVADADGADSAESGLLDQQRSPAIIRSPFLNPLDSLPQ